MIPSPFSRLVFSDRIRYDEAFEKWRLTDPRPSDGALPSRSCHSVIVWMMHTPEGRELTERLAAYWQRTS